MPIQHPPAEAAPKRRRVLIGQPQRPAPDPLKCARERILHHAIKASRRDLIGAFIAARSSHSTDGANEALLAAAA